MKARATVTLLRHAVRDAGLLRVHRGVAEHERLPERSTRLKDSTSAESRTTWEALKVCPAWRPTGARRRSRTTAQSSRLRVHFVETLHGLVAVVLLALQQVMHGHGAAVVVDVVAVTTLRTASALAIYYGSRRRSGGSGPHRRRSSRACSRAGLPLSAAPGHSQVRAPERAAPRASRSRLRRSVTWSAFWAARAAWRSASC